MTPMRPLRPGDLIVILDPGAYYGAMAEYRADTSNGILAVCPVGGRDSIRTAWRWRPAISGAN